jgi:hypothetical protein
LLTDSAFYLVIRSDDAGGEYPGMAFGNRGAAIVVRAEDVERAREVLSES